MHDASGAVHRTPRGYSHSLRALAAQLHPWRGHRLIEPAFRPQIDHESNPMKLLTHNMLQCHIKGVQNGFPLKIEAEKVETREMDYEPDFLRNIFPRIQWAALREGAAAMGELDEGRRQHRQQAQWEAQGLTRGPGCGWVR